MGERGMSPTQAAKFFAQDGKEPTKLKRLRVAKGFSQSELAAISGIPVRRIQHYEQRKRLIDGARIETLCNLALALDCGIEDIIESKSIIEKMRMTK